MLETVGVLSVATVGRSTGRLDISRTQWLRPHGGKKSRRVEGARTDFHIIRLKHDTALVRPVRLEAQDQILKMHYLVPDVTAVDLADYTGAPKALDLQSFERQRQNGHFRYEGSCLKTTIALWQVYVCPMRLTRLVNPAAGVKRLVPTGMIFNSAAGKDA